MEPIGHASFTAEKPKTLSKSPALTERPLKKLTSTNNVESKEDINYLRERFDKYNKTFPTITFNGKTSPNNIKARGYDGGPTPTTTSFNTATNNIMNDNNNNNNIKNVPARQACNPPTEQYD